ncbi:MAG TPA: SDR family NAD(P)-dependent oxidoreductase [Anaerolineaceae bacterium]|jgi:nucleoside-diphosphate-sugar epimerase|nr:SDR family NAD(P)-dependent oxidoreductase [Anaerolineaceae bacterium]
MASYLLTGAAGFIGACLADFLLREGHAVYGLDNLSPAYDLRMKHYRLKSLQEKPNFHFIQDDITDKAVLERLDAAVPQVDALINLAAVAGVRASMKDPWSYLYTNTLGALNMLEYGARKGVKKFILASTSSLYGDEGTPPHAESAPSDHPLAPYAASKKGAEAFAYAYHHLYGLDVSVLRYFTVYGPAGRPDMVMFRFCQWIAEGRPVYVTGDGEQSRGFTYVDDIARGTMLALEPVGYDVFNLGGHEVITINRLIGMLEERLGRKADVRYIPTHPADVFSNVADVSKARARLGWEPQVGLEEGLSRLVEWYLRERAWAKDVETP